MGKEKVRVSLFAYGMISLIKNVKEYARKHLHLIYTLSKLTEYKTRPPKSVASQYTNDQPTEKEIKEVKYFIIAKKHILE